MAYFPPTGSVVAFQADPTKLVGTFSVVGTVGVSGNPSISGTVNVGNFPTNQNVSGSVVTSQGTDPWRVATNNSSVIGVAQGSIATVIIGGSIAASFTPPANQSVSGTVQVDVRASVAAVIIGGSIVTATTNSSVMLLNSTNVLGSVAVLQGTSPWAVSSGSSSVITASQGSVAVAIISGSVAVATGNSSVQVLNFPTNQSISGTVTANQGTTPWIVTGSIQGGMSVLGTVPVTQAGAWSTSVMTNVITSIATAGQVMGSVAVLQGTPLWNISGSVASRLATSTNSSVIVTWPTPSIVGTYLEDDAHTTAHRGLFSLGVRNDTVASFAGANTDYVPFGLDSSGRQIIKPFSAGESSVTAHASTVNFGTSSGPASVLLFAAGAAGIKNYITDFNISNTGGTTTLVTFIDADSSVLGKTIAPAGGGSNHSFNTPIVNVRAATPIGIIASIATSTLHISAYGYRAP